MVRTHTGSQYNWELEGKPSNSFKHKSIEHSWINNLPEPNQILYAYYDGKIEKYKEVRVKVIAWLPIDKMDSTIRHDWEVAKKWLPELFAQETDYVLICLNLRTKYSYAYYARTVNGEWYSFNEGNLLDVDGRYRKQVKKNDTERQG